MVGEVAASGSVVLHELTPRFASLEEAFMELTAGSLEFNVREIGGTGGPHPPAVEPQDRSTP